MAETEAKELESSISANKERSPISPAGDPDDDPEWKVQNDYSHYQPLDYSQKGIRLVNIAPGSFKDPLHCTLTRHLAPWDSLDFEALSYCWGDLTDTVIITLRHDHSNSQSSPGSSALKSQELIDEQSFNITKSLDLSLRHLRYEDRERIIWIDALCINQGSIRERNYVIPFMVDVYRSATCVVIFLGEENTKKNFTRIWQLMAMLKSALERALPSLGLPGPLSPNYDIQGLVDRLNIERKDNKPGGNDIFLAHMSMAFEDFFEYRWFQRVWVVQEAMNAKKAVVYCGDQKRDWVDVLIFLCMAVKSSRSYAGGWSGSLNLRDRLPPFLWTRLLVAQRSDQNGGVITPSPHLPLLEILSRGRAFAATDPRDKVFALLSFGKETHNLNQLPPRLKPDYAKSSSEVWRDMTRQWIIDHRSLDILGILREEIDKNNQIAQKTVVVSTKDSPPLNSAQSRITIEQPPQGHPSWALWHAEQPLSAQAALFRLENKQSGCSITIDLDLLDQPGSSATLSLRGMILDSVKSVQWPFKRWIFSESDIRQFNYNRSPPTSIKDGVLIAWGFVIGLIDGIGNESTEQAVVKANAQISIPAYPSGKSLLQAFIETLTCRRLNGKYFKTNDDETFDDFLCSLKNLTVKEPGENHGDSGREATVAEDSNQQADLQAMAHFAAHWADSKSDPDFKWMPEPAARRLRELIKYGNSRTFTEMCEYAEGRCFIQTKMGAFGLCPQGTREGDVVVSLSGGRTPFVLRRLADGKEYETRDKDGQEQQRWSLIGECYLHDLDISRITREIVDMGTDMVQTFHII